MEKIIRKTAELARLNVDETLIEDMKEIIAFASELDAADGGCNECKGISELSDLREDESSGSLGYEQIADFLPDFQEGYFCVPKVLEG